MTRLACLCGCGETPKGSTARFMIGHDARYKSQLVTRAIDGDQGAVEELEALGWTQFLEKRRSNAERKVVRQRNLDAGLPASTLLITSDMDEDTVASLIKGRTIRVETTLLGGKMKHSEDVMVGKIRCVAEGEIDFWVLDFTQKGEPICNQLRTVKVESIVGVVE